MQERGQGGARGAGGAGVARRRVLLPALVAPGLLAARRLLAAATPAPTRAAGGTAVAAGRTAPGVSGTGAAVPAAVSGSAAGREIAATVRLRPGGVAGVVTLRGEGAECRLLLEGGPVLLPGAPERIAALPIAGRQVVVAGVSLPSGQVLAVLAGWDGAQMRILGVESWDWHGSGPRRLGLRLAAVPDDRRVRLLYEALLATPRQATAGSAAAAGPGGVGLGGVGLGGVESGRVESGGAARVVVRREAWTDVLAWQEGGSLRSEPLRPVLAGTWQARMAGTRAAVAGLLATPCREIGVEALTATGLLDPLGRVAPG